MVKERKNRPIAIAVAFLMLASIGPFMSTQPADAVATSPVKWIRYASNPVLSAGPNGAWDDDSSWTYCNSVQYNGTGYRMYYAGYSGSVQKIGLATSDDGKTWTKYASNPVLDVGTSGNWDSKHVAASYVMLDGTTYKMWYIGYDGANWKIGYATSSDGFSWSKYSGNPVLTIGSNGAWDDNMVLDPCVLKDAEGYKMWYAGEDGSTQRIGYATSSDGISWTKYANNPVLTLGANNNWDDVHVTIPCVLNMSGTYRMWYSGYSGQNWGIGHATSSDGKSWTKYASNPVLSPTGGGWESHDVLSSCVVHNGTAYLMWYTGATSSTVLKFGLAEGWNTAPDAPTLGSPADSGWSTTGRPTFTWTFRDTNAQDSQTAYQVQVDDRSDFGSPEHDSGKVSSAQASHTPASAIADGTYYWRARVWDSDDDPSNWCLARTIKIDATPPSNPTSVSSTSHTVAQWSTDNTIDVSFSGASDSGSGLYGFSLSWDYSPATLPDTTREIDSTVSSRTSPAMSDSKSVYFHIRALDLAGNAAADAAHLGPFWVDATPPSNPTVQSPTHAVNVWSNVTTVNVNWTGADASVSGLNGYSVAWDGSPSTIPDTVKEHNASESCATGPAFPDGLWYFHIRTRDEAGNWAPGAAHFGPLLIDATPPFNPLALSSDRSPGVWSNDGTVDVQWRDSNGSLSGVEGFSYAWDASPDTVPDEVKDCDRDVGSAQSPPLADGSGHYFHIRTRDNAGNWNQTASHIGPFWIDTSPPANPVAITSGSHGVSTWSNDPTIDVAWSVADGGGRLSGYAGFSIVWDTSPGTIPDATMDLGAEAASATSPPMPDSDAIYFHIRALDRAGNWATDAATLGPFWIDSSPPKNPLVVESRSHRAQVWSARNTVEMNWSAADASISGVEGYALLWDNSADSLPAEVVTDGADTLSAASAPLADGDGWYFHIRTRDTAGNWATGAVHRGPYFIDTAPPIVANLSIDSGAPFTASPNVRISLSASDPSPGSGLHQRRHRVDDGEWSPWEQHAGSWGITLAGSDGTRTVRVHLRDRVENACPAAEATIVLDTMAPSGVAVTINSGIEWTNRTDVELSIQASDAEPGSGLSEMALGRDGLSYEAWEPFNSTRAWTLSGADGTKTVYVKVRDRVGNVGSAGSDGILLDTVRPVSLSVTIAGGAAYATNATVALYLVALDPDPASGVGEMAFSEDGALWTGWMPYSGASTFTFSPGDGTRIVHFRVRDRAGNVAGPASDTILLDTTRPTIGVVQVSGVAQTIAVVTWTTDEPSDGLVEYGTSTAYGRSLSDAAYSTQHSLTLTGLQAATEYHLRISGRDLYGNGPSFSPDVAFRTQKREDRRAPVVSNVRVAALSDRTALVLWDTDEPADSAVEYGTGRELGTRAADPTLVQSHSVLLVGLAASTVYYFRAGSTDPSGNGPGQSGLLTFATLSSPDTAPPVISGVSVTGVTDTLAVVSWTTDEPADSRLECGPDSNYTRVLSSGRLEVSHVVLLTGLLPGREYHFRVGGTDASGNGPSFSGDLTFTTATVGDAAPPSIRECRVLLAGTDNVTVEVVLDEPGAVLLEYGTTDAYGKTAASPQYRTVHRITIPGLAAGTTYHFSVKATDASGNGPSAGPDQTFRTRSAPASPGGSLLSVEGAPYIIVVIVALAALATSGVYMMGRRRRAGEPEPEAPLPGGEGGDREAGPGGPEADAGGPEAGPGAPATEESDGASGRGPSGRMEVVSSVSAEDLEDGPED